MSNSNIDEIFKDLEKAGKTDVNNLIKWMKDSKIMGAINEDKVRKLFSDVANSQKVELDKFKDVVSKLAAEQHKTVEQLSKQLAAEAPRIIDAAIEGLNAFKAALKGK